MTIRYLSRTEIRGIARELDFRPRKSFGQNFVHDANTLRRIVAASGVGKHDHVLEVGPGMGSLTLALLERGVTVTAVEIDGQLAERLPRTIAEHSTSEVHRLTVLHRDVLGIEQADLLGFSNGGSLIAMAAGGTGVIFFSLSAVATVTKRDFGFLGKFLFVGMIVVLLAVVANIFFQIPALSVTISAVAVMVFSAYILYDISRIVNGGETNYILATLAVYLDIYNVFVSLLNLLMIFSGERD